MWSRSHSGAPTRPKSRLSSRWTLVPQAPYTLRSPQPTHPNAEGLPGRPAGLPVLGLNQQSRPKTNDVLGDHTLATPSERPRRLGVGGSSQSIASGSRSGITSRLKPRRRIVAHDSPVVWATSRSNSPGSWQNSLKNNQETPTDAVAPVARCAQHQPADKNDTKNLNRLS